MKFILFYATMTEVFIPYHSFNESYIKIFEEKWMPKRERRGRNDQTHETGPWKGMKEFEVYTKTKTIENII